jgi:hypothetical protein
MGSELRVRLSEYGGDAEWLASLAGFRRQELLRLDGQDVTALRAGEPPPGARAFDVAAVGGLLITLGSSTQARAVISAIRNWRTRGRSAGTRWSSPRRRSRTRIG